MFEALWRWPYSDTIYIRQRIPKLLDSLLAVLIILRHLWSNHSPKELHQTEIIKESI
jgi:hypothetical protein